MHKLSNHRALEKKIIKHVTARRKLQKKKNRSSKTFTPDLLRQLQLPPPFPHSKNKVCSLRFSRTGIESSTPKYVTLTRATAVELVAHQRFYSRGGEKSSERQPASGCTMFNSRGSPRSSHANNRSSKRHRHPTTTTSAARLANASSIYTAGRGGDGRKPRAP